MLSSTKYKDVPCSMKLIFGSLKKKFSKNLGGA